MELAFNLLLTLLLELPIVGFFFRRKKRKNAYLIAFLTNIVTWPIVNIIRLNWPDFSLNIVEIFVVLGEGIAYWIFLECTWKKGLIISIIANLVSFLVTKFVYIPADFFQKRPDIIIH
ncbi:MAG: hypothetical protein QM791_05705 [Ferruginibacter sp.]